MRLDDLKLRTKLLLPILISSAAIAGIVGFGSSELKATTDEAQELIMHRDVAAVRIARAARAMAQAEVYGYAGLISASNTPMGRYAAAHYPEAVKKADQGFDAAGPLLPDKAGQIAAFRDRFRALTVRLDEVDRVGQSTPGLAQGTTLTGADLDTLAKGTKLLADISEDLDTLIADTVQMNTAIIDENTQRSDALRARSTEAFFALLAGGLLAIAAAAGFTYWLSTRKVSFPLGRLAESMRRLATGDLGADVAGQASRDEIGVMAQAVEVFKQAAIDKVAMEREAEAVRRQAEAERSRGEAQRAEAARHLADVVDGIGRGLDQLASGALTFRLSQSFAAEYEKLRIDFNGAMARLADTLGHVASNTSAIRSGTGEISTAADDLSRRTEQQAASLEETAAALDEITATVRKTSLSANRARDVVGTAKSGAEQSGEVVRRAVDAMTAIERSSSEIGQIIGVIDEIAFQTNLLALNAGVEAARAGDAGRGFAVVASEVRALAQRSADAAKEIKALITTSRDQVEQGVSLVGDTGQALERILGQVAELATIVTEIAASAQEQASGLDQINTAINQMDQVTQQNAAMVEESTAASHALSRETQELSDLVGRFQLGDSRGGASAAPVPARRSAAQPVAQLRTAGRGGAVRSAAAPTAARDADWQEF
ncbi:methyl-accepting chemotaxis protein [Lichenibacterium ramalinae]|nr:HAMP domain-containing methyl-accepting chemotaxis protein [Lichenibacterium ramalinae]